MREAQEKFEEFACSCRIWNLDEEIVRKASEIYADLWRRGELIDDADILIDKRHGCCYGK